jgi:hypothetical protein
VQDALSDIVQTMIVSPMTLQNQEQQVVQVQAQTQNTNKELQICVR